MKTHLSSYHKASDSFPTFCGEGIESQFTISLEQFQRWAIGDLHMYCQDCIELIPIIMLNED